MPNIDMKFTVKTSAIIDDPSKIAKAGLEAGRRAWIDNLGLQYPPRAAGVEYERTMAMAQKTANSKFIAKETVELKSTDYSRAVLLRQQFNGGFAPWKNTARNMITIIVDAFKNAVKEVTSGR